MKFSIGVCAYNERKDIGEVLGTLLRHETRHELVEIIVVASGCTDGTEDVVKRFVEQDRRVRLIVEEERRGKSAAVNQILKNCQTEILVMTDADCLLGEGAIDYLLEDFAEGVGAVSGRPIPLNDPEDGFWGYVAHLRYDLFCKGALRRCARGDYCHLSGYLYALSTGIVKEIPTIMLDDIYIGFTIMSSGYRVVYEPRATVFILHPTKLSDLVKQRYRTRLGHAQIRRLTGHRVSTTVPARVIPLVLETLSWTPKRVLYTVVAAAIEQYVALRAAIDVRCKETPPTWDYIETSKNLAAHIPPGFASAQKKTGKRSGGRPNVG